MEDSAFDGEQRRKAQKRWSWARVLVRPQTAKVLIRMAQALTAVVKFLLFLKDLFGS